MATATQPIPDRMSFHTAFYPDCDFIDDHIEERNMGDLKHSLLQAELVFWFRSHRDDWNIRVMSELRTRVSTTRVCLPDVTVAYNDAAMEERIRTTPPLIAVEILTPDDRIHRVLLRMADFLSMGIPHLWLLDPLERIAYIYNENSLRLVQSARLTLPDSPIYLDLPELFAALD